MQHRTGMRVRTDFHVIARDGGLACRCRGIEVSASGIVIDRGRRIRRSDERLLVDLELRLPERIRAIRTQARPIWSMGSRQALRFVTMSDADRLTLAEHVDLQSLRGVGVC